MRTTLTRAIALVAVTVASLAGCSPSAPQTTSMHTRDKASATPSETPTASTTPDQAATEPAFPADSLIGVSLPTSALLYWLNSGDTFTSELQAAGFTPKVMYADYDVALQREQIRELVDAGAKIIFVAAVNVTSLGSEVEDAKAAGVTVIALDRLLLDTDSVDYFVSWDMHKVGTLQAKALLKGLSEAYPDQSSYNVELFSGAPDDPAAEWFFDSAMAVLQPKIDDGTLVVVSGQTTQSETSTENWSQVNSEARMESLLASYYSSTNLDGVLAPNDGVALSVIDACQAFGKPIPVITGQDSLPESVTSIMNDEQYMTVDKSPITLAKRAVVMAQEIQRGRKPPVNDNTTYDNGWIVVPAYLLMPVVVTKENAAEVYQIDPDLYRLTQ